MPQTYRCPHCSKPLQVPDDALGKPLRCPTCKQLFSIRAPVRQPAVAAAAPAKAAAAVSRPAAAVCPICRAPLAPGSSACLECGYLAQSDSTPEVDGLPSLCANPACGVAN